MRLSHQLLLLFATGILAGGCRRNQQDATAPEAQTPEIAQVTPTLVQAGDTLTVSGKYFRQTGFETSVFLSGRPVKLVSVEENHLTLVVPEKTQTGTLIIHVGRQTAIGPSVGLLGTPTILTAAPLYVYAGDTVALTGRDLGNGANDLHIWLDGKPAKVVDAKADTAHFIVPAGVSTKAVVSWQTLKGPIYQNAPFKLSVRRDDITGNNILEYLMNDPGMDLVGTFLQNAIDADTYSHLSDTLRKYVKGDIACTMFLPNNASLNKAGVYTPADGAKVGAGYEIFLNAVHIGLITESQMQPILFKIECTNYVYNPYGGGNPNLHGYMSFIRENGLVYATGTMNDSPQQPVYPNGERRQILKMHKAGNCIIYETDGFTAWPYGLW